MHVHFFCVILHTTTQTVWILCLKLSSRESHQEIGVLVTSRFFQCKKTFYFHTQALRIVIEKFDNQFDKFDIEILHGEITRILKNTVYSCSMVLSRSRWIDYCWSDRPSVTLWTTLWQNGDSLPWVKFSCSRKAMLSWLKALLTKKVWYQVMLNMNKNGSFRSHQTCKNNDQCKLWYRFMKFLLFGFTSLYRL